jgi:hypothetical protein
MTIGMVSVACLAARIAGEVTATMTSTFECTRLEYSAPARQDDKPFVRSTQMRE